MKKQNGIRAVLWTVLMLAAALTGCCADGEDAWHAGPGGPARFTCGGVEYITLREAVPRDAVGRKLGDIQTLAAVDGEGRVVDTCGVTLSFSALARLEERLPKGGRTVQVLNVWALPGTTGRRCGRDGGRAHSAAQYPRMYCRPEAEVLSFARQAGGIRGGLCGEAGGLPQAHLRERQSTLSQIHPLRRRRRAHIWAVLARSCVFDADTGGN